MKFSLVNVEKQEGKFVDGTWMQNHIGTLETATGKARATEKANSNRITVAVVEDLNYGMPNYSYRKNLVRLD